MKLHLQRILFISASSPVTSALALAYVPSSTSFAHRRFVSSRSFRIMAETPLACTPGGKCVPCESLDKSHLLSPEQIDAELSSNMPLWKMRDTNKISRSYTARNFQCAMDSMVAIGKIAERENHHPDMHLTGYRDVEIVLFTHSLGGISANDIALAKMIDGEVTFGYSPKWLKAHPEAAKKE